MISDGCDYIRHFVDPSAGNRSVSDFLPLSVPRRRLQSTPVSHRASTSIPMPLRGHAPGEQQRVVCLGIAISQLAADRKLRWLMNR